MRHKGILLLSILIIGFSSSLLIFPHLLNLEESTYLYTSTITYTNDGGSLQILDAEFLSYSLFLNTSWQTASLETVTGTYLQTKDFDGNLIIIFDASSLNPGESHTFSYSMRLEETFRRPPDLDFALSNNLSDIPDQLRANYTTFEGSWIPDEDLTSLAYTVLEQLENTDNVLRIATGLADWIGTNVNPVSHDIPYYPSETLHTLEGDCDDQANLLIVLCRILGIPSYLQLGALSWSSYTGTYWDGHITSILKSISYHGWAMIYVPPWGWLPFDMTLGWKPGDSLSVVNAAKVWSLKAMPMLNVRTIDWAGGGRTQRDMILTSSINIDYKDQLILQNVGVLPLFFMDSKFWFFIFLMGCSILVLQLIRSQKLLKLHI